MQQKRSTLVGILGNAAALLVGLAAFLMTTPVAQAQAQSTTYVYYISRDGGFGILNLSTGQPVVQFEGGNATNPSGLGVTNKILYSGEGSTLDLIDQGNGNPSPIGSGIAYADFGSANNGILYALDADTNLYSVNSTTGQAAFIGQVPTVPPPPNCNLAMSSNADVVYIAVGNSCGDLMELWKYVPSPTGGHFVDIGNTGIRYLTSMVFVNGTLYGEDDRYNAGHLWTISTQNGAGTQGPYSVNALGMAAIPSATITTLYSFTGSADGATPTAGLTLDDAGNLYGTASQGGDSTVCTGSNNLPGPGCGTAFKLKRGTSGSYTFNPLYKFRGGEDGATPLTGVVFGSDGTLYGTTYTGGLTDCNSYTFQNLGCGVVFNLKPPPTFCRTVLCSWDETVLQSFDNSDGAFPGYGSLIFDAQGNIYGTTVYGGARSGGDCDYGSPCGTVYELMRSGGNWTESVLFNFDGGADGGEPQSGVILDHSGNLYGTTYRGGQGGEGLVYQLLGGSGWSENILYNAWNSLCPITIYGGLVFDSSGNLYGTSNNCGESGQGFVYELTPSGGYPWNYSEIYSFAPYGDHSAGPWSNLVIDSSGNLYGTYHGFAAGGDYGRVFELTQVDGIWTQKLLWAFTGGADGATPIAGVVFDASGNLYGTTTAGGNLSDCSGAGCGVVWEITNP